MDHELQYNNHIFALEKSFTSERVFVSNKEKRELFNSLYKKLYLPVYHFAKTFVDSQDAEDIVADSFLKLWRSNLDYTILPKVRTWLNVCTRNACLDLLRESKSKAEEQKYFIDISANDDEYSIETDVKEKLLERLYFEIERLPPKCKQVFKLAYLEGHRTSQIAAILAISENTVSNHRVKALKLLRLAVRSHTYLLLVVSCSYSFCHISGNPSFIF